MYCDDEAVVDMSPAGALTRGERCKAQRMRSGCLMRRLDVFTGAGRSASDGICVGDLSSADILSIPHHSIENFPDARPRKFRE